VLQCNTTITWHLPALHHSYVKVEQVFLCSPLPLSLSPLALTCLPTMSECAAVMPSSQRPTGLPGAPYRPRACTSSLSGVPSLGSTLCQRSSCGRPAPTRMGPPSHSPRTRRHSTFASCLTTMPLLNASALHARGPPATSLPTSLSCSTHIFEELRTAPLPVGAGALVVCFALCIKVKTLNLLIVSHCIIGSPQSLDHHHPPP
jgi:hypothetical protein